MKKYILIPYSIEDAGHMYNPDNAIGPFDHEDEALVYKVSDGPDGWEVFELNPPSQQ